MLPPRPDLPPVDSWPAAGIGALVIVGVLAWLRERTCTSRGARATPEEELAGWAVALLALLAVSVIVALASPYTLVFVVPSLYAWLACSRSAATVRGSRTCSTASGLLGPVLALVVLTQQLDLGLRARSTRLARHVGHRAVARQRRARSWVAVAAQVAALVAGRYAPPGRTSSRR